MVAVLVLDGGIAQVIILTSSMQMTVDLMIPDDIPHDYELMPDEDMPVFLQDDDYLLKVALVEGLVRFKEEEPRYDRKQVSDTYHPESRITRYVDYGHTGMRAKHVPAYRKPIRR